MASQLKNEHGCVKHCWGVYEQNSIREDDWTAEREIIASNMFKVNDDTQKVSYVHCG